MRFLRSGLAAAAFVALLVLGFRGAGPLPPVGPLLDPWRGVWAAASTADLPGRALERVPGLTDTVRVIYDDRAVPHIFAASELDAYRALGYAVARDRLFQLELQTRATGGRLTELVGRAALRSDRSQRALGLDWSAEREWAEMDSTSEMARATRAFAEGVNAWIDALGTRDLPLEYHLLKAHPMRWQPQYTLYLMKRMGYTLAYDTFERQRERLSALIGDAAATALFPLHSPIQQPIQPGPGPYPRYDFTPLPPPVRAGGGAAAPNGSSTASAEDPVGSNNWAVAPGRSATGHALLAGDPHLDLSLPSIWYEVHLATPGLDVYGVTIPGVPGVVIGFNRDVAWSFTNTGSDVLDLYVEQLDDNASPTRYVLDGTWRPLERRVERYLGPKGDVLAEDTVYHTHRGPVTMAGDRATSVRWLVLETGAGDALLRGQRARGVEEWLRAMEAFKTPAQNGVVADRAGNIAIRSSGSFPIRPGTGRGDRMQDGTSSRVDWMSYWPLARYPFARNPAQGYLVSANQEPKDPRVDPAYLGNNWPSPWRAVRINQLLRADSAVTVDAMRRYQTDPGSARADALLGLLVEAGGRRLQPWAESREPGHAADLNAALGALGEWNRRYAPGEPRAVLFEFAMQELQTLLWDELIADRAGGGRRVATPGDAVLLLALRDSTSSWWDNRGTTDVVETRDDIVAQSLAAAWTRAQREFGDFETWRWDRAHQANIYHLLGIRSLSATDLPVSGGPSTISPSSGDGTHGASWRMVVELGPEVRGFGVYPGGQSGNPVSPRYQDRLRRWLSGDLDTLRFPRTAGALGAGRTVSTLRLVPGTPR